MEEQIREEAWNLCKLYHTTPTRRKDPILLRSFVSDKLEQEYGAEVENEWRQEAMDEVRIFVAKYWREEDEDEDH